MIEEMTEINLCLTCAYSWVLTSCPNYQTIHDAMLLFAKRSVQPVIRIFKCPNHVSKEEVATR
jgi:hypothetical protein